MHSTSFLERLPTHVRRLENGLTVLVREDHSAPVVAVVTHVCAGYFDEPDEVVGISHVLEHMFFKGTKRRGPGAIARETKEAGGYLNAGTIYDRTSYYTVLPAGALEQALDIQADALQNSVIDEDELRRELQVIVQEAKRKLDNPDAFAQETLFATMFDAHRMRRWRIGSPELLPTFTRDDVNRFYRSFYRPGNTIVAIAGDVDADDVFRRVQQQYGPMEDGPIERYRGPEEQPQQAFRYREMEGDIAQSLVEWGWHTPGTLHDDTAALGVLAIALGQGRASRLYRHVRDAGVASSASSYHYTPTDVGVFGISLEVAPHNTAAAMTHTAAVLRDVLEHGITEEETARARNIIEARALRRLETMEGQATLLAEWQAHGDWRMAGDHIERCLAITPQQLLEVARRYLQPDAATALLYRPRGSEEFATDADSARRRIFASLASFETSPDSGQLSARAVPAGATRIEPLWVEDGVRCYDLGTGSARLILKQRRSAPLVSLGLYSTGGSIAEPPASAGITALMARTSVRGTRRRNAHQLAVATEALGASISPGAGTDLIDWSISLPSRHLRPGLQLLLEAALEPTFPAAEAERERRLLLADIDQIRDDMHQYPLRLALSTAFAGHPYGLSLEALENGLRTIGAEGLSEWHRQRVLRGAPHIFIVGDVEDADATAALCADLVSGLLDDADGFTPDTPGWHGPAERVESRDKAQTAIAFAFAGPPRNHPDVFPLQVLSSAISGLGGRLFEELRSKLSLAYSVSAGPMPRWLGGAFVAYIGTGPEREAEARAALLRELARTAAEPLPADDLERAQRYMVGTWQIRQQTNGSQLGDLAWALLLGGGLSEIREHEARIRAVTAEMVQQAAARWLLPDRVVTGIVRGRSGG
jgi:zinc protease